MRKLSSGGSAITHDLLFWLAWLDQRIRLALAAGRTVHGPESAGDPYRGLYITPADVDRLLLQPPGQPLFAGLGPAELPETRGLPLPFRRLADQAGLSGFDIAVILLALAPEFDLRYERLYAYLQDDVTRKWPTVDLAMNLLCSDSGDKRAMRSRFLRPAPLVRYGLLQLVPEGGFTAAPLLGRSLRPDPQVAAALLGTDGMAERLHPACELLNAAAACRPPGDAAIARVLALVQRPAPSDESAIFHFHGPDALARRGAAEALALALGRPLLRARLSRLIHPEAELGTRLQAVFREAWMRDAVVYFEEFDTLAEEGGQPAFRQFIDALADAKTVVLLGGMAPWAASGEAGVPVVPVAFAAPDTPARLCIWRSELQRHGLDTQAAEVLAARFRLGLAQIGDAVRMAAGQAHGLGGKPAEPGTAELFAAARQQTRHLLSNLAQHIEPVRNWDDLVLPDDGLAQLREICARHARREEVLEHWGFARKLAYGTGTHVLFAGPSGTGKTMAAEIMAGELGLDVLRIDLARVVSKYIGETEKNLDRIFSEAQHANAILFFDEADALFGKRSEVKDSHDRYANLEISYLLQKMEQYEGIAILATNLRQNLDEAFVRRLAFIVQFPFPDETQRRRLWAGVWPEAVPLAGDVDLDELARQFKLSGGTIRNVALAAAFLAAEDGRPVGRDHVLRAVQRELRKEGKSAVTRDGGCP